MFNYFHKRKKISVSVEYYNDVHRQKLNRYASCSEIQTIVNDGVRIPLAEFLTYYWFHLKGSGLSGFENYSAIESEFSENLAYLRRFVGFSGSLMTVKAGAQRLPNEVIEHIGESVALSVVNRIHGLTQADWSRIDTSSKDKSLDFELASDGKNLIQVEAKGHFTKSGTNTAKKGLWEKLKDIEAKKLDVRAKSQHLHSVLLYGAIVSFGAPSPEEIRCWICDPPAEEMEIDPRAFRLVSRMRFLRDFITLISPKSAFSAALSTRTAALEALSNPFLLDGVPLKRGSGYPFNYRPLNSWARKHSSFMTTKSRVRDFPAGGIVFELSDSELFLIGIREELLNMAANQDFGAILDYRVEPYSESHEVDCAYSQTRFELSRLPAIIPEAKKGSDGYYRFSLSGELHFSDAGLVFGILPLE